MNEYYEYFGPTYRLDVPQSNTDDLNTREYLEKVKAQVFENLRHTGSAPSVQLQREFRAREDSRGGELMRFLLVAAIPRTAMDEDDDVDEDSRDPNNRRNGSFLSPLSLSRALTDFSLPVGDLDARIQRDDEYSDSEDEGEGNRRDSRSHRSAPNSTIPIPALSDAIPPATKPPVRPMEVVEGEMEGEEIVEVEVGPPAVTSAARATTIAEEGEDDARGETVYMKEDVVVEPGVPVVGGEGPL